MCDKQSCDDKEDWTRCHHCAYLNTSARGCANRNAKADWGWLTHHSIRQYTTTGTTDKQWTEIDKTSHELLVIDPTSTCPPFTILVLRINLHHNKLFRCPYVYITARNTKVLQQASLLAENPRSSRIFHTFPYKRGCSYSRYDVVWCKKSQCVKTLVVAKPRGISSNHTCQSSLLTLR